MPILIFFLLKGSSRAYGNEREIIREGNMQSKIPDFSFFYRNQRYLEWLQHMEFMVVLFPEKLSDIFFQLLKIKKFYCHRLWDVHIEKYRKDYKMRISIGWFSQKAHDLWRNIFSTKVKNAIILIFTTLCLLPQLSVEL